MSTAPTEYENTPSAMNECGEGWFLVPSALSGISFGDDFNHLVPENDLVEHPAAKDCICDPSVVGLMTEGDEDNAVYFWQHKSLDGRDLVEDQWDDEELEERRAEWQARREIELAVSLASIDQAVESLEEKPEKLWALQAAKRIVRSKTTLRSKWIDLRDLVKHVAQGKPESEY